MRNQTFHRWAIFISFACLAAAPPTNSPTPSKEQSAAAEKMVKEAQTSQQFIHDIQAARPPSPEFQQLKLDTSRQILQAQLLLNPAPTAQKTAIDAYAAESKKAADDIQARVDVDATFASVHLTNHALAEAQTLQSKVPVELILDNSWETPPATSPEQRAAAEQMVKEASDTSAWLEKIADIRPLTPEFIALRLEWSRKQFQAQLLLTPTGPARKKAIDDFTADIQKLQKGFEARAAKDAPKGADALYRYALAQAEWLQATPAPPAAIPLPVPLSPEQRDRVDMLRKEASAAVTGIFQIENIRPRSPEFVQLKCDWLHRELDAQLLLCTTADERMKAIASYTEQLNQIIRELESRLGLDIDGRQVLPARYALAEADYLKASLK